MCIRDSDVIYTPLKSEFNELQFRRRHYRSIFIRLAVVDSQSPEITRNSDKIWPYSSSRSSKVIVLGVNRKPMNDFLLVTNSNFGRICWIFPTDPCLRPPFGGNPLEFGDEIWRQKTRVLGLPVDEEIMPLAFFVLTNTSAWQTDGRTDWRTDTLLCLLPALA